MSQAAQEVAAADICVHKQPQKPTVNHFCCFNGEIDVFTAVILLYICWLSL